MQRVVPILVFVVFAGAIGFIWCRTERTNSVEQRSQRELAQAVEVLPPGTEVTWMKYVDQQLWRAIQRNGETLKLTNRLDQVLRKITFISLNSPYSITCDPVLGIDVDFTASGVGTISIPFYVTTNTKLNKETPPSLSVDVLSVAAARRTASLCERVSEQMQEIVGPVGEP